MARYVAVDSHQKTRFVVIVDEDGVEQLRRRFDTTAEGESALLEQLAPGDTIVMEASTGVFRLANRLETSGARVIVVDPQHARLVGMRGKKTDYRDCLALLQLLRAGTLVEVWRPDALTRQIRQMTRERDGYNRSIVAMKNRIQARLWEEGLQPDRDLWEPSGREWLAGQGLPPPLARTLDREWRSLSVLLAFKCEHDDELAALATALPDAQRLMQITGFGAATAVMFLGEVGPVSRFPSPGRLVSYAGLNPRVHQSGNRCRGGRISKAGRSPLRWLMVEAAWTHVRESGPHAHHYHRLLGRGKEKGVAITALARHLLVVAYLLLAKGANHRDLNAARYEDKLTRLAARRPVTPEWQPSNVDWAADQLKTLTGLDSPHRQTVRSRRLGRRVSGSGALPARAASFLSEFPALKRSDPSDRKYAADPEDLMKRLETLTS